MKLSKGLETIKRCADCNACGDSRCASLEAEVIATIRANAEGMTCGMCALLRPGEPDYCALTFVDKLDLEQQCTINDMRVDALMNAQLGLGDV